MSIAVAPVDQTELAVESNLTCDGCGAVARTVDDLAPSNWIGTMPVGDVLTKKRPTHHFCGRTCLIGHYAPMQGDGTVIS